MTYINTILVALMLVTTTWSSHLIDTLRNQRSAHDHRHRHYHAEPQARTDKEPSYHPQSEGLDEQRTRRSYYPWASNYIDAGPCQPITIWQPSSVSINRPYFIPVLGVPGQHPIFYPPQALNPFYQAPQYLPPPQPQPQPQPPPTPTKRPAMEVGTRFGEEEERPIWGMTSEENNSPPAPPAAVPTRRPRPGRPTTTPPPLIRNNTRSDAVEGAAQAAPAQTVGRPQAPPEPSRCVWAIISCCTAANTNIRYDCFEQLGCTGVFWDNNPCTGEFANAAIQAALNFYDS